MHCAKYNGFQSFFICLAAVRLQIYAKIQLPIHTISHFSTTEITHENILKQTHETSVLDIVLQTSGSTFAFVANYHD